MLQVLWFVGKEKQSVCNNKNVNSYQKDVFAKCYQGLYKEG